MLNEIANIINLTSSYFHSLPPTFLSTLGAYAITALSVSGLLQYVKAHFDLKGQTARLHRYLVGLSFGAAFLDFLANYTTQNPTVLGANTAKIALLATSAYHASKWLLTKANALQGRVNLLNSVSKTTSPAEEEFAPLQ